MLIGLALVTLITWIKVKYSHLETITGSLYVDIAVIAIAVLLCLVGLIGYCGAGTGHKALLRIYICFIILLVLVKAGIVVLLFTQQDTVKATVTKFWNSAADENRDQFQKLFSCCDIANNTKHHDSQKMPSCFKDGLVGGDRRIGCIKALSKLWDENLVLVVGIAAGVVFSEIMTVIVSCLLICFDDGYPDVSIKKSRVSPMRINVQSMGSLDEVRKTPDIPLGDRRQWAKLSCRSELKPNSKEN